MLSIVMYGTIIIVGLIITTTCVWAMMMAVQLRTGKTQCNKVRPRGRSLSVDRYEPVNV